MTSQDEIKIAVLDDYSQPQLSALYFNKLLRNNNELQHHKITACDSFPETLDTRSQDGLKAATERYRPYHIICTMRERTPFPAELLRSLPNLKLLLTTGTRNAALDLNAARAQGIAVAGTVGKPNAVKGFDSTNEQTWALILAVARGIADDDIRVKAGAWQSSLNLSLAGRTLGLLGLGKLGAQCATTGKLGFGMKILAWSENLTQEKADRAAEERGLPKGSFVVAESKEALFRNADVVSIHNVLSDRSRGIVGEQELKWMKKSAILVNTSRGPLIDEKALVAALRADRIRGVGLDVFDVEPLPTDSVWRDQSWGKKVTLSPHMGYVEEDTLSSWYEQQVANISRYLSDQDLQYVMNPESNNVYHADTSHIIEALKS